MILTKAEVFECLKRVDPDRVQRLPKGFELFAAEVEKALLAKLRAGSGERTLTCNDVSIPLVVTPE